MSQYTPLIVAALAAFSFSLRKLSPKSGWLHSAGGALAIAFVSGLMSALADAIQRGGLSKAILIPAVAQFVISFLAAANPSMGKSGSGAGTGVVGLMLACALFGASGCATANTPKDATFAQKLRADAVAFAAVAHDVEQKCGPNLLSFVKTVNDAIAAARDYTDLIQEVVHAAALYADAKMDIASVECVIATVRADLKNLSPKKAAMLDRLVADLEARQSITPAEFYAELSTPPICDYVTPEQAMNGAPACRPLEIDNDDVSVPTPRVRWPSAPPRNATRAAYWVSERLDVAPVDGGAQ